MTKARIQLNGERKMTTFRFSPEMKNLIYKAKIQNSTIACDPRAFYPAGHKCAGTTQPIIDKGGVPIPTGGIIRKAQALPDGGKRLEVDTPVDTVTAITDANGSVTKVAVKEKPNWIPWALAAGAFLLLGG